MALGAATTEKKPLYMIGWVKMPIITAKHSGSLGDIVYSLCYLKALADRNSDTAYLYLKLEQHNPAKNHPLGNVLLNKDWAKAIIPLINSQDWLRAKVWKGEQFDLDLDYFRYCAFPLGDGDLVRYYTYADELPTVLIRPDLPWIEVEADRKTQGGILVNLTNRYRNNALTHFFLNDMKVPLWFVGLENEFQQFSQICPKAKWIQTKDLLHVARLAKGAKLCLGNQSCFMAICEAVKANRVLEICPYCPNVRCNGANGAEAWTQEKLETICQTFLQ